MLAIVAHIHIRGISYDWFGAYHIIQSTQGMSLVQCISCSLRHSILLDVYLNMHKIIMHTYIYAQLSYAACDIPCIRRCASDSKTCHSWDNVLLWILVSAACHSIHTISYYFVSHIVLHVEQHMYSIAGCASNITMCLKWYDVQ